MMILYAADIARDFLAQYYSKNDGERGGKNETHVFLEHY